MEHIVLKKVTIPQGYNPKKPGRPSHTYHTFSIANLRLILDVEVQVASLRPPASATW